MAALTLERICSISRRSSAGSCSSESRRPSPPSRLAAKTTANPVTAREISLTSSSTDFRPASSRSLMFPSNALTRSAVPPLSTPIFLSPSKMAPLMR